MSQASEAAEERTRPVGDAWRESTTRRQRLFIGLGTVLLALGALLAVAAAPSSGPAGLVAIVGFLGGLVGLRYALRAAMTAPIDRRPPPVEQRPGVEVTGADFDAAVREVRSTTEGRAIGARSAVRTRLGDLATRLLAKRTASEATAADRIASGDWTTDDRAARLVRGEEPAGGGWLSSRLGAARAFEDSVEATVDALEALQDASGGETHDEVPPRSAPTGGYWRTGRYRTGRWRGLTGLALLALMTSAIARSPGPALTAAVLLGLVGYTRLFEPPAGAVEISRTFDPAEPAPGERVTVTVAVENVGPRALLDLRVIDGVPDGLGVVDGSPRLATALGAGESDTYSYTVRATPGEHDFSTTHLELRDPSGEQARATTSATSNATLVCDVQPADESVPLHPQTTGLTGRVPTDEGGEGVEFHSVRAYRRGDPLSRVDWNRLARTGDLATRQLREEHAAMVVLLLDVRHVAARAPAVGELSGVDRSRLGAAALVDTLLGDGDRVGLATIGADRTWIPPGGGQVHRDRLAARLGTARAEDDAWVAFDPDRYVRRLRRRLPAASQLICFSPLLDDEAVRIVRRLHAHGHAVSVVSPDPTTRASLGGRVVRLERNERLRRVRAAGLRVVDWAHGEGLPTALERARRGWRA